MNPLKFSESYRQELRRRGRKSLWFYGVSILGFSLWMEQYQRSILAPIHQSLAAFLEGRKPYGPWRQALVFMPRGGGKSVWTSMVYPCWRTQHSAGGNLTWKLIENTDTNAYRNHFKPMLELFTESPRASFLQWLYQEEIPAGFRGWNSEVINWNKTNPEVGDSLSYWGLNAKWEGAHPGGIGLDDLEGADANKTDTTSEAAWDGYQNAIPLLRDPANSQLLIVGTPHGPNPFIWRVRESELGGEIDNARRQIKIFWHPLLDDTEDYESCIWPERFPKDYVEWLKKQDVWDQQYMGRKKRRAVDFFDMVEVEKGFYRKVDGGKILEYESIEFDPNNLDAETGITKSLPVKAAVAVDELRYFLHIDPVHKAREVGRAATSGRQRPSEAGQVVVGVAPDMHAFVAACWSKPGVSLEQQASKAFQLYCTYACHLVTVETVGAQAWFLSFVEAMERAHRHWRFPMTIGPIFGEHPFELPRLSTRLVSAEKTNQAKDYLLRERLAPWVNSRLLHFHKDQTGILHQLRSLTDESVAIDMVDALSQGPGRIPAEENTGRPVRPDAGKMVWSAPASREHLEHVRRRRRMTEMLTDKLTGWRPVWNWRPGA